jgi:hypothetical protein
MNLLATGFSVLHHFEGLPCAESAHRDMVLLVAAGGNAVCRRGMAQHFVFGNWKQQQFNDEESIKSSKIFSIYIYLKKPHTVERS